MLLVRVGNSSFASLTLKRASEAPRHVWMLEDSAFADGWQLIVDDMVTGVTHALGESVFAQ